MEAEVRDFSRLSRSGTVIMNGHVWPFSLPSNSRLREPKVGDRIHVVEAVEGEDGNEIVEWRYHS